MSQYGKYSGAGSGGGGGGGTVTSVTASSPLFSSGGTTPNITIQLADATHNGYLSSVDWNTFNNKQTALTLGNLTDAGTDGIVITGGTGAVVGAGTSIAQHVADSTHNGYLSSVDWSTFNSKQASGNYITALTGDVTASGPGSAVATIAVGAVTDAKASLADKPASAVVATTNQTLSGFPVIDGVTPVANTLILLTAQSTPSQNGPWQAQVGAWTRPSWYPSGGTTQAFQFITTLIRLGTVYQGSVWRQTATAPITIDTTATTWVVTPLALNANTLSASALIPIANGGTGATTKAAAFDALSPMTTQYDLIYGGAAGTGTRLAKGANNTHLTTQAGVVSWTADPTPYSVSTISGNTSGVSGTTYLCDTSGAAFNLTLPTPVSGAFVIIKDKTGSFGTNNLTVLRNGTEKIEGLAASKIFQTNWGSWSLFSDGTDWYIGPF